MVLPTREDHIKTVMNRRSDVAESGSVVNQGFTGFDLRRLRALTTGYTEFTGLIAAEINLCTVGLIAAEINPADPANPANPVWFKCTVNPVVLCR